MRSAHFARIPIDALEARIANEDAPVAFRVLAWVERNTFGRVRRAEGGWRPYEVVEVSKARIARDLGCTRSYISKTISRLVRDGVLFERDGRLSVQEIGASSPCFLVSKRTETVTDQARHRSGSGTVTVTDPERRPFQNRNGTVTHPSRSKESDRDGSGTVTVTDPERPSYYREQRTTLRPEEVVRDSAPAETSNGGEGEGGERKRKPYDPDGPNPSFRPPPTPELDRRLAENRPPERLQRWFPDKAKRSTPIPPDQRDDPDDLHRRVLAAGVETRRLQRLPDHDRLFAYLVGWWSSDELEECIEAVEDKLPLRDPWKYFRGCLEKRARGERPPGDADAPMPRVGGRGTGSVRRTGNKVVDLRTGKEIHRPNAQAYKAFPGQQEKLEAYLEKQRRGELDDGEVSA